MTARSSGVWPRDGLGSNAAGAATAIAEHPALPQLRRIDALQEMARRGGRFSIGMRDDEPASTFSADAADERRRGR